MRFIFKSLYCVLFLAEFAFSQNIPSFPIGEYWQFPDARTLGMAGAGSVSNSSIAALQMNPAAMAAQQSGLHLMLSSSARSLDERRSFPIFNRFDDINQQGIYVINNNWFLNLQGGVQYNFDREKIPFLKSIAIGAFTELDQDYQYEEEVRENIFGDELLAYNRIDFDGRITRYTVGTAFQFTGKLKGGFQAGILSGDLDQERTITFVQNSENDLRESTSRTLNNTPIMASLGATYDINPYLIVGSHVSLPYSLDYDLRAGGSTQGTESIEYPLQFNAGLEYRGQQALQARLNVDITYEWWSKTDYRSGGQNINPGFDDVIRIKTGIEHFFFNQIPFQAGLQYRTTYQDRSNTRLLFTAGTGFIGNFWQINVAGGFSRVEYKAEDLFDDSLYGGDRSNSSTDDVEEQYFFGVATLKVNITP